MFDSSISVRKLSVSSVRLSIPHKSILVPLSRSKSQTALAYHLVCLKMSFFLVQTVSIHSGRAFNRVFMQSKLTILLAVSRAVFLLASTASVASF